MRIKSSTSDAPLCLFWTEPSGWDEERLKWGQLAPAEAMRITKDVSMPEKKPHASGRQTLSYGICSATRE